LCQPRDQVFTETLNKEYHHRLLHSLVEVVDEGGDMLENLKKINPKEVYWTPSLEGN
jgi:dGTP triphosphohydrolase